MSVDMKLMPPSLERPRDCAEHEVKPRELAVSTTQACGSDGAEISSVTKILRDHEMRELEEIFVALEEDRRHLQSLLLQQKEEHEVRLSALEREMIQERLDWEREMRNREEALRSVLMAVAIGRGKLMSDLRSHMEKQSWAFLLRPAPVPAVKVEQPKNLGCCEKASPDPAAQSTRHLGESDGKLNAPVVNQERQSRTWWGFKKRQTTAVAVQDVSTSSASKEADLLKIAKLEERIRKAELQKQQKASKKAAKAEKEAKKVEEKMAKKMEKKAKKEAKEAEKRAQKEAKEAEKRAQKEAKKAEKAGKKAKEASLQE